MKKEILLLSLVLALLGCGYALVGTGSSAYPQPRRARTRDNRRISFFI